MRKYKIMYLGDGYAKNISIFLKEDGFRLSPFNDVISGKKYRVNPGIHHYQLFLFLMKRSFKI